MRRAILVGLFAAAACGPPAPVAYPDHSGPLVGSVKRTLRTLEEVLRHEMIGVTLVKAPGNEEPVTVAEPCVSSAWFTLPGAPAGLLGESYQYQWHLCVGDDARYQVNVSCLEVKRSEGSTDSHECSNGQVAKTIAERGDGMLTRIAAARRK